MPIEDTDEGRARSTSTTSSTRRSSARSIRTSPDLNLHSRLTTSECWLRRPRSRSRPTPPTNAGNAVCSPLPPSAKYVYHVHDWIISLDWILPGPRRSRWTSTLKTTPFAMDVYHVHDWIISLDWILPGPRLHAIKISQTVDRLTNDQRINLSYQTRSRLSIPVGSSP